MSEYPFNLKGVQRSFSGGRGDTYKSSEFYLHQGVVIAEITHHGHGECKMRIVPAEGFSEGEAAAAQIGGGAAAGFATGAVLGSIVPVAGTIVGGVLGGLAGWLAGDQIGDLVSPTIWTLADTTGQFSTFDIEQAAEGREDALPPGKYRLEVDSKSKWECRFIQPDLGQADLPLIGEEDDDDEETVEPGLYIFGPCNPTQRPLLANVVHTGHGDFVALAYSLDGTHRCIIHGEEGQFYKEQIMTEIRPGKEYMFLIAAASEWSITFSEGY